MTPNRELLPNIMLAELVNGVHRTHLRLSIRKRKPTSQDELFKQTDKYISHEELETSFRDGNSQRIREPFDRHKKDEKKDGAYQRGNPVKIIRRMSSLPLNLLELISSIRLNGRLLLPEPIACQDCYWKKGPVMIM